MWGTLVPAVQLWTGDLTCPASAALPVQWANNHRPPSRWRGESDRERLGRARSAGKVYGDGLEVLHTLLLRASPDLRSRDVASFRCIVSPRRPLELARPRFASCMVTLRQCHASSCLSPLRSGANNADLTGSWGEGGMLLGTSGELTVSHFFQFPSRTPPLLLEKGRGLWPRAPRCVFGLVGPNLSFVTLALVWVPRGSAPLPQPLSRTRALPSSPAVTPTLSSSSCLNGETDQAASEGTLRHSPAPQPQTSRL